MLNIQEKVPLSGYSTMRLGGPAAYLTEVRSGQEVIEACEWAQQRGLPLVMIGGGSNIIWPDEGFGGLVIVNKIMAWEIQKIDEETVYLTVGAGEPWDSVVARTTEAGLSGIEQLSLIPGTAGATPIQNVGAYGREISEVLVCVQAYDQQTKTMVTIPSADCGFAYRTSRFRTTDKGRFLITNLTLHLTSSKPLQPFYPSVQSYFEQHGITDYTAEAIREAVISIRREKLPDPSQIGTCGSFFYNPIVETSDFHSLVNQYPGMPGWPQPDGRIKIPAAWLLDKAGFSDYHDPETGMATWPKQSLNFVNEHARSTADVLAFKEKVAAKVKETFGIELEQEPELISQPMAQP